MRDFNENITETEDSWKVPNESKNDYIKRTYIANGLFGEPVVLIYRNEKEAKSFDTKAIARISLEESREYLSRLKGSLK